MKIAVAMSGGVDSSVAAALMVEKYGAENVFGVTMKLFCYGGNDNNSDKSCCSIDSINDAAFVCKQLGIPHYVVNLEKEFDKAVIQDFIKGYANGLTPNPCIRCNQIIKYDYLLKKVELLGADKLVTGHYARIYHQKDKSGTIIGHHLLRGLDPLKDQSYFLYNLTQSQLEHIEFPIGELRKTETRKIAKKFNLITANKTESQDICFVTTNVQDFLSNRIKQSPGNIVNSVGEICGTHKGLANYTIGQRKGLGGGFSKIMYVIGVDKSRNEIIIGPEEELYRSSLVVDNPHWILKAPDFPLSCSAKIRYASEASECIIRISETNKSTIIVDFRSLQKAITPGQSIVFYDKDEVIGGGVIASFA